VFKNNYTPDPSQFSTPFYSQRILRM